MGRGGEQRSKAESEKELCLVIGPSSWGEEGHLGLKVAPQAFAAGSSGKKPLPMSSQSLANPMSLCSRAETNPEGVFLEMINCPVMFLNLVSIDLNIH